MNNIIKIQYEILKQLKDTLYSYKNDTLTITRHISEMDWIGLSNFFIKNFHRLQATVSRYITDWQGQEGNSLEGVIIGLTTVSAFVILSWLGYGNVSALFRARNCKVACDWDDQLGRIGQLAMIKISFIPPPGPENVRHLLEQISIKVQLGRDEIVLEKDARDSDGTIFIKFRIEKAGTYEVYIWYCGFPICGTPFSKYIEPDLMDPNQTQIVERNPMILTQGRLRKVDIIPIDQYGNRCSANEEDLMKLSVEIKRLRVDQYPFSSHSNIENELIANFELRQDSNNGTNENLHQIIALYLKSTAVGVYFLRVLYGGVPLPFEEMEIISVSDHEQTVILQKEFQEWRSAISTTFKASWIQSLDTDGNMGTFCKDVIVELSPRFFYLKEKILDSPMLSRLATFRICPLTKVKAVGVGRNEAGELYSLEINDSMQNSTETIMMDGSDARIFLSLVSMFSYCDQDALLSLEIKQLSLYKELSTFYLQKNVLRMAFKILKIRRSDILESTLEEVRDFTREDWGKPFVVSFFGEQVKSDTLAWQEWSEILVQEFFENNPHGMFCYLGSSGLVHPNPHRNVRWTREHYELAGKIVGKYLLETALDVDEGNIKYLIPVRFTRSFLVQILSIRPTYKHLQLDDPDLYMGTVNPILSQDVTGMSLMFTGQFYDRYGNTHIRELIPNGNSTPVTQVNKISYLNALADLRLAENIQDEMRAFKSGLSLIIPEDWLMNFDENELEILLCGSSTFSLKEIQLHHVGGGEEWNPYVTRIKEWLWRSLKEMTPLDIGRFLQFTTGSSRLPPGGFVELKPRLKITVSCLYGQIPSSNQNQHHLFLTDHPSFQDFADALSAALRGFDKNENYKK